MNEVDYKRIEEFIFKAIQAGKSETSGLVTELRRDLAVMKEHDKSVDEKLGELVIQVKKTNGSVISLKMWRAITMGAISIITIIVIPLIVYIFTEQAGRVSAEIQELKVQIK